MITLSYADAVKLCEYNDIDDVFNLDSYYQKKAYDEELRRLNHKELLYKKKIKALEKQLAQLQNKACLYEKSSIKKKYRPLYDVHKLLSIECGLTEKEIKEVYGKYGQFAGARNYGYRMLGLPIPIPEDKCDNERKAILKKYREIRDTAGIKEAKTYFINADNKLKGIEEV